MEISSEQLARLRSLRLWHWRSARVARREAEACSEAEASENGTLGKFFGYEMMCKNFNAEADFHIRQVQTLNEFFNDLGDTAEQDNLRNDW